MKKNKSKILSLDNFIDYALYDKKKGYYIKKNPFGKNGDFITAPNISILFSEMISIWLVSYWNHLNQPKKIDIIELGAGNGALMKGIMNTLKSFPNFYNSCNFLIYEKSKTLIDIQKKNISSQKISWKKKLEFKKKNPVIFIANEFFDALPIKHLTKIKTDWYEKYVEILQNKGKFRQKKIDINKYKKDLFSEIIKKQKFIEYSPLSLKYLRDIGKIINTNDGGLLLFDYGYSENKFKDTLQAIQNHKYANILDNIGNRDITYNLNFYFLKKFIQSLKKLKSIYINQRNFLLNMGIMQRAEIISKKLQFSKKADLFYRVGRLIDEDKMGSLFKVMFVTKKNNSFKVGF